MDGSLAPGRRCRSWICPMMPATIWSARGWSSLRLMVRESMPNSQTLRIGLVAGPVQSCRPTAKLSIVVRDIVRHYVPRVKWRDQEQRSHDSSDSRYRRLRRKYNEKVRPHPCLGGARREPLSRRQYASQRRWPHMGGGTAGAAEGCPNRGPVRGPIQRRTLCTAVEDARELQASGPQSS